MTRTILAIDMGGTRFRAGIAPANNPVEVQSVGEWPAPRSLADFTGMLERLIAEHGTTRLGLGVPGFVEGTVCRWIPNLPYLDGLDLAARFPDLAIGLGNDAQISLLAEAAAGAAKGLGDVILLAIGTGIGSAVMVDGAIVAGSRGAACSFGWAAGDADDRGDATSGWLERQASGRALDQIANRIGLPDGGSLVDAARAGSAPALAALDPPMRSLGMMLAGAVALLDPRAILFAGGVVSAFDVLAPLLLEALHRHLPPHLRGIDLRQAHFGSRAGLVGAAYAGARGQLWRHQHG